MNNFQLLAVKIIPGMFCVMIQCFLMSCSPVKTIVTNQYKLDTWSNRRLAAHTSGRSILVTHPEAATGYQTDQMLYVKKHFEVSSFAHNAWVGPPGDMLLPLIIQSLQNSGYFSAVSSSPNNEETDYRLDTQLIELQQVFIKHPSEINLSVKAVLINVHNERIVASRIFRLCVPCPADNPYGGVVAANQATKQLTAGLTDFIANNIIHDNMAKS